MRQSFQPTDYVILRAGIKSDWDRCDFVLLHICPDWAFAMRQRLAVVAPFRGDPTFYSHVYWDVPLGYYVTPPDSEIERILHQLEQDGDSWALVALDSPDELESLSVPESQLDTHMLMINADGGASYRCYGKHTGEEYATEGFSLNRILKKRG